MSYLPVLLKNQSVVVLDSAMGTELKERGVDISGPLWSANAIIESPDTIRAIHIDNIDAGADIITTNTFRTNRRTFEKNNFSYNGLDAAATAKELTKAAVELAQDAVMLTNEYVLTAGCVGPVEDCYRPDLVPDAETLSYEHFENVRNLVEAGADIILAETMGTVKEISAVLVEVHKFNKEFIISLLCKSESELYSGEPIEDAIKEINKYTPHIIAVNCIHPKMAEGIIKNLKTLTQTPLGVYANVGEPGNTGGDDFKVSVSKREYYSYAKKWKDLGVRLIGGCCGTNPDYIKKISGLK